MIYELRSYEIAPGQTDDFLNSFRVFTKDLFKKHNLEIVGFWVVTQPKESRKLVGLLRFADENAREAAWAAFQADPQWQRIEEQREANGSPVESITEEILNPTVFSPMR